MGEIIFMNFCRPNVKAGEYALGSHRVIGYLVAIILPVIITASRHGDSHINRDRWTNYDDIQFETESPNTVEIFNPVEWIPKDVPSAEQVTITHIKVLTEVKLRYARTRIILKLKNKYSKNLQASFRIGLPGNAFFTTFELKKGKRGTIYSARIVNKDEARTLFHYNPNSNAGYIELFSEDKSEVLKSSNFTLKFNLIANQTIQAYLIYERLLERVSQKYSDEFKLYPLNPIVFAKVISLLEYTVIAEEPEQLASITCSTRKISGNCTQRTRNVSHGFHSLGTDLKERNVPIEYLDQDPFQFSYLLKHNTDTKSAVVVSQNNGNYYFAHLLVPENVQPTRKHILFLLDKSDSMTGRKMEQLQWSMKEILDDLGKDDFINIIAFSSNLTIWNPYGGERRECQFPYPANAKNIESAQHFIDEKLIAHGSTNIYLGLSTAFQLLETFRDKGNETCAGRKLWKPRPAETFSDDVESMIFFLSDGNATSGPTDPEALLAYVQSINQNRHDSPVADSSSSKRKPFRIHTVAYGNDANVRFLRSLSQSSQGLTKLIVEDSGAGVEMATFYHEISSNIVPKVETVITNNSSQQQSMISHSAVTIMSGDEVFTAGELTPPSNGSFNANSYKWHTKAYNEQGRLDYFNSPLYDCTTLGMTPGSCIQRIGYYLERLQASVLLRKLLEQDELVEEGYLCPHSDDDTFQQLKMEAHRKNEYGNAKSSTAAECYNIFKDQVKNLALKFRFITPYTSFVITTNNVDKGLLNGSVMSPSNIDSFNSNEAHPTRMNDPATTQKPLKLLMIGSMTSREEMTAQYATSTNEVHEPLPQISKLVSNPNNLMITLTQPVNVTTNLTQF